MKALVKRLRKQKTIVDTEIKNMERAILSIQTFNAERFNWPERGNAICIELRETRIGIDYVEDAVDIQLQREATMLSSVGSNIGDLIQNVAMRTRLQTLDLCLGVSGGLESEADTESARLICWWLGWERTGGAIPLPIS